MLRQQYLPILRTFFVLFKSMNQAFEDFRFKQQILCLCGG